MNYPHDRHGDNRWNRCVDLLVAIWNRHVDLFVAIWNRHGPDATLKELTALELGDRDCRQPCDDDCPFGRVHCWFWHRPEHVPDWHHPARCDAANKDAATREAG